MASWSEFETAASEFAAAVRERFAARKHCTIATLRRDGSPRISGIEVQFADGELRFGSMPDAVKLLDLRRDGRCAIHSPTVDPPNGDERAWPGEAKVAGRAHEDDGSFRLDLTEVVLTRLTETPDGLRLQVSDWRPGHGLRVRERE